VTLRSIFIGALVFAGIQSPLQAQNNMYKRSSWWFGPSGGANLNLYHGSTQVVNSDLTISANFRNTKGVGPFAFPTLEFHRPDSKLGFTLNVGYDNRSGSFDPEFSTKLAYITVEPVIRLNLFRSPLFLFSGPRIALNVDKRFTYQPDLNSAVVNEGFNDMKKSLVSMQIGAGYDLLITPENKKIQVILAPFVSIHPYFGQNPRSIESWNLTTLRAGIALKFGSSHKKAVTEQVEVPVVIAVEPEARFIVNDSRNIPVEPAADDVFPLQNYVFFNLKSSEIQNPTKKPGNGQVKKLNESQIALSSLANLSDSSFRQDIVHDNFLSRLGDQMVKNPLNTITLIGASKDGVKDGQKIAEAVKVFLVGVYEIDASKIVTKARRKLNIHPEQYGSKKNIALLRERDRQVLVKSNSSNLQMVFRGGGDVPLKPMRMNEMEEANIYNNITFKTEGAKEAFSSWVLKITDDQGKVQNFGPYTRELVCISGKSILGNRIYGRFEIVMAGKLKSGETIMKDTTAYFSQWIPPVIDKILRFKVLYEYNNSKAINIFTRYLTDVITPNIPQAGKVIIHGHTENVGGREYSPELFLSRANDTRSILENALAKAGRTDVKFEVYGLGKDQVIAPFRKTNQPDNISNRTIIIDVISKK